MPSNETGNTEYGITTFKDSKNTAIGSLSKVAGAQIDILVGDGGNGRSVTNSFRTDGGEDNDTPVFLQEVKKDADLTRTNISVTDKEASLSMSLDDVEQAFVRMTAAELEVGVHVKSKSQPDENPDFGPLSFITKKYADATVNAIKNFKYPLNFDFRPFNIFEREGTFFVDRSCRSIVGSKINDLIPYYLDYENGSNLSNGLSPETAFKTIPYALAQGARLIYLRPGDTIQFDGFGGTILGSSYGNEDVFLIQGWKGAKTTIINNMLNPVFTASTGTTYTASITGNTIDNVMDRIYKDEYGYPSLLVQVASATLVNTTPGSYNVTGTTLKINTLDGRTPDADIFLIKNANPLFFNGTSGYVYTEGISFVGGASAFKIGSTINTAPTSKINYLSKDCEYVYSGLDGYNFEKSEGLTWIENCVAYKNRRDGFNYKQQGNDSMATAYFNAEVIEVNCQAFVNGYKRDISNCNGSSAHQQHKKIIRVGGKYWGNRGPNVVDVRATKTLNVGVECFDCIGVPIVPTPNPGGNWAYNADFAVGTLAGEDPCMMWLYGCKSKNVTVSYHVPEFLDDDVTPDTSQMFIDQSTNVGPYFGSNTFGLFTTGIAVSGSGFPSVFPYIRTVQEYVINSNIEDTFTVDPASYRNATGIRSADRTTGQYSDSIYVPGKYANSSVKGLTLVRRDTDSEFGHIYDYAEDGFTGDVSEVKQKPSSVEFLVGGSVSVTMNNSDVSVSGLKVDINSSVSPINLNGAVEITGDAHVVGVFKETKLAAGTYLAGTAPLKFNSGVNLTDPEDGAVEYDGSKYYVTSGSVRYELVKVINGSANLNFPSTATQSSSDLTISVPGVSVNDVVSLGIPAVAMAAPSCGFLAWVSATDTVTVRFNNFGLLSIDPVSATFNVTIKK